MTLEDIARKLDTIDTRLSTLVERVDEGFSASEKESLLSSLANLESKVNEGFNAAEKKSLLSNLANLELKVDEGFNAPEKKSLLARLANLESKVDEGFNGSKVRDEELLRLTQFGLEAGEVMRQSINRRVDATDRKHDDQISLLQDVIRSAR